MRGNRRVMEKIVGLVIAIAFVCLAAPGNAQEIVTDEMLASADITKGKTTFLRCRACHTLAEGDRDRVGPNLWGLFDSEVGFREEFKYSQALQDADFTWTPDKLNGWLAKPKDFLPNNKMAFVGLNREQDRINLIVYLMEQTKAADDVTSQTDETGDSGSESDEGQSENMPAESTEGDDGETSETGSDESESAEQ
ncbi:MAG: c-type cytochrome [Alphaproteobacteria bacterium]|nr:MAG: c-type cytochrome [Alphaproteobacteria bacterium]